MLVRSLSICLVILDALKTTYAMMFPLVTPPILSNSLVFTVSNLFSLMLVAENNPHSPLVCRTLLVESWPLFVFLVPAFVVSVSLCSYSVMLTHKGARYRDATCYVVFLGQQLMAIQACLRS